MCVEFAATGIDMDEMYPFDISNRGGVGVVDWEPMIRAIMDDIEASQTPREISARFHNTLADSIVRMARMTEEQRVILSGGCFQNRYLTEKTVQRLREEGLIPYWHQRVPPNDGGIALGQIAATMYLDGVEGGDHE
jgi:hydrogenase maturation protein HypF